MLLSGELGVENPGRGKTIELRSLQFQDEPQGDALVDHLDFFAFDGLVRQFEQFFPEIGDLHISVVHH